MPMLDNLTLIDLLISLVNSLSQDKRENAKIEYKIILFIYSLFAG